jgi:threonine/homoserine/homoserine lactone efflux protein
VPNTDILILFIPTFFLVSLTPGMCMTLALTLGMSIGIKKTLWMMLGELIGVAIVAVSAILGIAVILQQYPTVFILFKIIGASYLFYLAYLMFHSKSKLSLSLQTQSVQIARSKLFSQGLITAIANPKGWAFMVSLLPPFIDMNKALSPQLSLLVAIILCSEFVCMMLYATGGKTVATLLKHEHNIQMLNRISATLMALVAIWLLLS